MQCNGPSVAYRYMFEACMVIARPQQPAFYMIMITAYEII